MRLLPLLATLCDVFQARSKESIYGCDLIRKVYVARKCKPLLHASVECASTVSEPPETPRLASKTEYRHR